MTLHDVRCGECGQEWETFLEWDESTRSLTTATCTCGGRAGRVFHKSGFVANAHHLDRTVIFQHPTDPTKWSAPDRNDRPMPDRLRKLGYEKKEFYSVRDLEKFEKSHHVVNEAAHYDRGSGTERPDGIRGS